MNERKLAIEGYQLRNNSLRQGHQLKGTSSSSMLKPIPPRGGSGETMLKLNKN